MKIDPYMYQRYSMNHTQHNSWSFSGKGLSVYGPGPNGERIGQYGPNGEFPGSGGSAFNSQNNIWSFSGNGLSVYGPGPNGEQIGQYGPNGELPGSGGFNNLSNYNPLQFMGMIIDKMMQSLGYNTQASNGTGPNGEQIGQYGPNGELPGSGGSAVNNHQKVDRAILGCFKAFNIQPTGNKNSDMMALTGNMIQSVASGNTNPAQEQSISRLMDQLGIKKSGDKNADFIKMLGALMDGGQQQFNNTGLFA